MAEYYQTLYPRHDKYDGKIILFKNKDQYLTTDFNTRENLRDWIKATDSPTVRAYLKGLLEFRKEKKGLIWAPTQVELRTTMLPPIQCYNQLFGDYYALCDELGLKNRFQNNAVLQEHSPDYIIHMDNREQNSLDEYFSQPREYQTLKFGDYYRDSHPHSVFSTCPCYIERKNPKDFLGTMSGHFERFCRELDRSVLAGAYMIILVEATLARCLNFKNEPNFYPRGTTVTADYIFRNVRDILQKYPNIQFLFVKDQPEAARTVERIFNSGCSFKNVDLQELYDTQKLYVALS